jgi:aarF domain-containing kinase
VSKQAQEVMELINEITGIALRSGPAGVARSFKAFEAVATTGQEWLQGDRPSPPALLRKLCERLGATYVKLGQFIASSPTLFPEEYVLPALSSRARAPALFSRVVATAAHTHPQRQWG